MVHHKKFVLAVASVMVLGSGLSLADTLPPPAAAAAPAPVKVHGHHGYDMWMAHTHDMLQDMKAKLNLSEGQQLAWKAWSEDVTSITRDQTERVAHWRKEHEKRAQAHGMDDHAAMTTPERMSHGLEHMRVEIQRLQDHVSLLEKLQASTQTFYDKLDTNQKTIFDLYWQQAYHLGRMLGQHDMMHHEIMGSHQGQNATP